MRFNYPASSLPDVALAGKFHFSDRNFSVSYLNPYRDALHVYSYFGRIRLCGVEHIIEPGTLTITPVGSDARYHLDSPGHHHCVHFRHTKQCEGTIVATMPLVISLGAASENAAEKIIGVSEWLRRKDGGRSAEFAASCLFQELMLWLSNIRPAADGAAHSRQKSGDAVDKAAEFLDSRVDEPFDSKALLRHVGLSKNYLERLFKARFGQGMQAYSIRRKMEYAKFLLESTDLPVKMVGAKVGFPDPQHFNKRFKIHSGASPSSLRQVGRDTERQ